MCTPAAYTDVVRAVVVIVGAAHTVSNRSLAQANTEVTLASSAGVTITIARSTASGETIANSIFIAYSMRKTVGATTIRSAGKADVRRLGYAYDTNAHTDCADVSVVITDHAVSIGEVATLARITAAPIGGTDVAVGTLKVGRAAA